MRDLISFQCDQCKRRNYTSTQEQEDDHRQARLPQILSGLSIAHAPQGGQVERADSRWRRGTPCVGSVALIGRAPDSKSGGCRFEPCLARSPNSDDTHMALQEQHQQGTRRRPAARSPSCRKCGPSSRRSTGRRAARPYAATAVVHRGREHRRALPRRRRLRRSHSVIQADPPVRLRHGEAVVRGAYVLGLRAQGEGRARGAHQSARQGARTFGDVLVPAEKVVELVKGRKKTSSRMFFPGYILVNMELNDETWHIVKSTPKVTGLRRRFDRSRAPISETRGARDHATRWRKARCEPKPKVLFESGEHVKVDRRPVPGLQRRRRRGEARQGQAARADQHLRSRDAGRARLRPGREGVTATKEHRVAKKVIAEVKLQIPAGRGESEPAGRSGARPARRQHHGVLQAVQRADAGAAGHDHPGDHHRVRATARSPSSPRRRRRRSC